MQPIGISTSVKSVSVSSSEGKEDDAVMKESSEIELLRVSTCGGDVDCKMDDSDMVLRGLRRAYSLIRR